MAERYHPKIAEMAATYDEIIHLYGQGRVDMDTAKRQVADLAARDDQGVIWRINPENGNFYRETFDGRYVEDEPPEWGISTPSARDISGNPGAFNPGAYIHKEAVSRSEVDADGIVGSTWNAPTAPKPKKNSSLPSLKTVLAALAVGLIATIIYSAVFTSGESNEPNSNIPSTPNMNTQP